MGISTERSVPEKLPPELATDSTEGQTLPTLDNLDYALEPL